MILKPRNKTAIRLAEEYPYSYNDIVHLQEQSEITDEQLKDLIRIAAEGHFPLNAISRALIGFKNYLCLSTL